MQSGVFTADIGTSSLKAAIIDETGNILRFTRLFFPPYVRAVDWVRAFFSAWIELTADCSVQAICISGNGPTLVAVQEAGREKHCSAFSGSRNVSYSDFSQIIRTAENDVLFLWNEPSGAEYHRSKTRPAASENAGAGVSLFLPRVAAFYAKYPHVFVRTSLLLSGPEYLLYLLTGQAVTVLPERRYESAYWTSEQLHRFADASTPAMSLVETLLPPFVAAGTEVGRFSGVPVIAGVPDFIAALIGTGTLAAGTACDRAGSSEGINICTAEPHRQPHTLLLPSIISELWNISFLLPDSGTSFSAFLTENGFSLCDYTQCMELIAAEPFRLSESYPHTFAGNGRNFIERLAFRIRYGCDLLEKAAGIHPVYTLSGGQARNSRWCQMKADITGRTFAVPHFADAELLGNAVLGFYALHTRCPLCQLEKVYDDSHVDAIADIRHPLAAFARQLLRIERYYEPDTRFSGWYSEKYVRFFNDV